jgi:riboflavin synthase
MFTGLIEAVCKIQSTRRATDAMIIAIDLGSLAADSNIGDSIAVNGACLTITSLSGSVASFDVSAETLEKTTLERLSQGQFVNIERALKACDRLGGHIVQGHIDGAASIKAIEEKGKFKNIKFAAVADLLDQMVVKGSVAVDGVSLTVMDMDKNGFTVAVIPQTLEKTTLCKLKIGDAVNIETDMIIKTIKKHLDKILPQKQNLTMEKLKDMGF